MPKRSVTIILRAVASVTILVGSVGVIFLAYMLRPQPHKAVLPEKSLRVDVVTAEFKDVPVQIVGLGEMRSRDIIQIAPEISGRIVQVHPKLEVGGIIPKGEVLFEIDPRDYQARLEQSEASVEQLKSMLERLRKQYGIDKERLKTFERSRNLAKGEYERVKKLYEQDSVGTQSGVDNSEMMFNNADDAYDQLAQSVDLYPIRIEEAEASLESAEAAARLARVNLERTKVTVGFDARVKTVSMEEGQTVQPGTPVLTLADDSLLEIAVPLDSRTARNWLDFSGENDLDSAWFSTIREVPVTITWTGDPGTTEWQGTLNRVEKFDQLTRQIVVVAQVSAEESSHPVKGNQPLVEGMFCKVEIPGKMAHNVVEVPIESVSFSKDDEGYRTVFIAKDNGSGELRLNRVRVLESHQDGKSIFLKEGIEPGMQIITTRLINPLANSLLSIQDTTTIAETD